MPITLNGTTGVVTPGATVGSITGILKATSGVVSQAVDGTDYVSSVSLSAAPTSAKAWFTYDGVADSLNKDYGILSVIKTATGRYTITFDSAFPDINYCSVIGGKDEKIEVVSRTTSSMNINILTGTTYNNSDYICIAIFA